MRLIRLKAALLLSALLTQLRSHGLEEVLIALAKSCGVFL